MNVLFKNIQLIIFIYILKKEFRQDSFILSIIYYLIYTSLVFYQHYQNHSQK